MDKQSFVRPVPVYDLNGKLLRWVEGDLRTAARLAAGKCEQAEKPLAALTLTVLVGGRAGHQRVAL